MRHPRARRRFDSVRAVYNSPLTVTESNLEAKYDVRPDHKRNRAREFFESPATVRRRFPSSPMEYENQPSGVYRILLQKKETKSYISEP
jgi:hypothetical protein